MTLAEFNMLSFNDKYKAMDRGVFLYNYLTNEEAYECYSFDKFFIEVVYNEENSIIEFRSFETEKTKSI
ncbi:hypothetical protein [Psychroserpens mesophilus]|uniref:hypothetical protein n=1 Tax=Psychroserpens mesophilus TaxID=325473 RepID=UPI00058B4BF8|nr:hypothetical protein [Psychroserpens mesophilus]